MQKYKRGISVIVCCYNSAERLPDTIRHLVNQKVPSHIRWEVILVDNNSQDATSEVARREWEKYNTDIHFTLLFEGTPGKQHAIDLAMTQAAYEYILICDDDNWLNPDYVRIGYEIMESDPAIGALGGMGIAQVEKGFEAPAWFQTYQRGLGTGPQGREDEGDTTELKKCLYSASMFLRRSARDYLYEKGFRSTFLGRTGKTLASGEDRELTLALRMVGYKLWFSPRLHFQHYMPAGRIQWPYFRRLHRVFGANGFLLSPYYHDHPEQLKKLSFAEKLKNSVRLAFYLLIHLLQFLFKDKLNTEGSDALIRLERGISQFKCVWTESERYNANVAMAQRLYKVRKKFTTVQPKQHVIKA